MKRLTLFCILLACFTAALSAHPKHEVRAVWLTTIGGIDWPSQYAHDGMGIATQKEQFCNMLDRLKAVNVNTILLQTRVRATTIYPSDIEPWDGCLSGKPGVSPGYDALQFAIDECHRRGMELHAWVVTIPIGKWQSYGCQQLRRRHQRMVKRIGDEGYLNPESPQTADYLANICEEITRRYDIDGIHLDYIRYPETWRGSKSHTYITNIVRNIHEKVKMHKPWVKLSCSPIGKYDDLSRYRSNGWNANRRVAQDAQGWMIEGLMDQLYPMMYFAGNQFYPFAIDWQENSCGRMVSAGLGVYMLSPRERNWPLSEMQRQLNVARSIGLGHTFFRAKFLLDNVKGIYDYVRSFDCHPALIPPMSWNNNVTPSAPEWLKVEHTTAGDNLTWHSGRDNSDGPYLLYNIYASETFPVDVNKASNLLAVRHLWQHLSIRRPSGKQHLFYAVTAVDRYGNESPACQLSSPAHSTTTAVSRLIANDGSTLRIPAQPFDAATVLVCSPQGNLLYRFRYQSAIDISHIPEGSYLLYVQNNKKITHRLGYFIIKRQIGKNNVDK